MKYSSLYGIISVKDPTYGAMGDGVNNDTTAIQNAINAAAVIGTGSNLKGCLVYFPPGSYVITASLKNNIGGNVGLVGAGKATTYLNGNVSGGYTIDQNDGNTGIIDLISDLRITNSATSSGFDANTGAIRFNNAQGGLIRHCLIGGWTGIAAYSNAFNSIIEACDLSGTAGSTNGIGTVGIYSGQISIIGGSTLGYWVGVQAQNVGLNMVGHRTESCNTGIVLGKTQTNAAGSLTGFSITGHTTERCGTAIDIYSASAGHIGGCTLTGTVGPGKPISTATIASTTATITVSGYLLDDFGWTSGTKQVKIESVLDSGYNTASFVTATRTSSTTFTYTVTGSPVGSSSGGTWSFKIQYWLRAQSVSNVTFNGITTSTAVEQVGIDFNYGANTSGTCINVVGCSALSWAAPPAITKASFKYINCNNPSGSSIDALGNTWGMNFADLPGQSGVYTPVSEGQEYDIINDNSTGSFGATSSGGGTRHAKVRYNGSTWTICGV